MNRRRVLGALASGALGLAGCLGKGPDSAGGPAPNGSPDPGGGTNSDDTPGATTPTTQFQYDARNSGVADSAAPAASDVRWRTTIDPIGGGLSVADGRVVVAASGNLTALDADTGDVLWDVPVGHGIEASPALTADTAYVATWNGGSRQDRGVAAIDLEDGSERWRALPDVGVASSPTVADGHVYVGGSLNSEAVIAIDAEDGSEQWRFRAGQYATTPAVDEGVVYVGGGSTPVAYALDASDGTERWQVELDDRIWGAPSVVGGTAYVGSREGQVYALAAADGATQWTARVGEDVRASVAATDDSVFVASEGAVASLGADGTERWTVETSGYAFAPTIAGDAVVVTDRMVSRCLDARDGNERWRHEVPERQISDMVFVGIESPPVVANGVAYVASHGGDVYALAA